MMLGATPLASGGQRWLASAALLLGALLMSGCAAPKMARDTGDTSWNGRLALTVHSDPPQSYSAGFDLHGSAAAGQLLLSTPLGTTLATLTWAPGKATMTQGDQTTQHPSLEELSAELGVDAPLPLTALFAWLDGRPMEIDGWRADLSRHADGRVTAQRAHPLPAAELRLVFEP